MSSLFPFSPSHENATCLPSGENVGDASMPGYDVSGMTRGGGRFEFLVDHNAHAPADRASTTTMAAMSHAAGVRAGETVSTFALFPASTSSSSNFASAIAWRRRFGSFSRHR